jgi:uracil phosphoribosyltransferase
MLRDQSADPMMRLLVDSTRRARPDGPALARAHRKVGHALARIVAEYLPLDEDTIDHVVGPSRGVRLRAGAEPIIVAMLRAGLFVAEGIWESFPGSSLVLQPAHASLLPSIPAAGRTLVLVDGVINTGNSIRPMLKQLIELEPMKAIVVTLVGYRPTLETIATEYPSTDIIAARVSDNSYVGKGGTDTGARLFGTTTWPSER